MRTITLELRAEDAEPILRKAAYDAAKFGALCDYMTPKTHDAPTGYGESVAEARKRWQETFLSAKRIVEAFGIEYEPTSEQETLTLWFDYVGGKKRKTEMGFIVIEGSQPDFKHPRPAYRREVHSHACHAAAERVVRAWRQTLQVASIARLNTQAALYKGAAFLFAARDSRTGIAELTEPD